MSEYQGQFMFLLCKNN